MNLKTIIAGLSGVVVGVLGYYFLGRSPASAHHIMQPTSPTNLALIVRQDVKANDVYAVRSLMPKRLAGQFTQSDLSSFRKWMGPGGTSDLATYEVLTFPNHHAISLWITQPIGTSSNLWQVQQMTETSTRPVQGPVFAKAHTP